MHGIVFSIYFHIGNCLVFFFYFVINGIYSICNGAFQGVLEATNVPFGGMFSEPDCHDDTLSPSSQKVYGSWDLSLCIFFFVFSSPVQWRFWLPGFWRYLRMNLIADGSIRG